MTVPESPSRLYKFYLLGRCEVCSVMPERDTAGTDVILAWSLGVQEREAAAVATVPPEIKSKESVTRKVKQLMGDLRVV